MRALATRLLLAFPPGRPPRYAAWFGAELAVWLHLSMITDGLTLRIVAGVALGVLVNGDSAGALHPRRGRGWRCSRCSASSPGCRACGLPLTERMIWPQALTYGVPTLALSAGKVVVSY